MVKDEFDKMFNKYKAEKKKDRLSYVVTSGTRSNDPDGSPHKIPGNAMDFTLRTSGQYSTIKEYNDLFKYMMDNWFFRAGIDNTEGNIHIHIDLGLVMPKGQVMPFFFKEDGGRYQWQIKTEADLLRVK